jgi:tetratricopeptide (TPR) repeat protein
MANKTLSIPAVALLGIWSFIRVGIARDRIEWRRDHRQAFAEAQERRQPVLLQFRGPGCFAPTQPGTVDTLGRPIHDTRLSDCDLMQADVWERAVVAEQAARFQALLVDGGDPALRVRYQVVRVPTVLLADPWGNEILRFTGYAPRESVVKALGAVPADFAPLTASALALQKDPRDATALVAAARFYEAAGLRQVSERLYDVALATDHWDADLRGRRQVVVARCVNLMQMGRNDEAAGLFDRALQDAPEGPDSDALLYGLMAARLQAGKRPEAQGAYEELLRRFPDSRYVGRAAQVLQAGPAKTP